jgi:hypothetical protein
MCEDHFSVMVVLYLKLISSLIEALQEISLLGLHSEVVGVKIVDLLILIWHMCGSEGSHRGGVDGGTFDCADLVAAFLEEIVVI